MSETIERFLGCLLGLACGDAVGTTLEFCPPGTFTPIDDMLGDGPFDLRPGEWTDDTSMALCMAESLIEKETFDPKDQLERYVRWYRQGHLSSNGRCFDIGNTTRQALTRFEQTGELYGSSDDSLSASNGSLMRLAPAAMAYARQPTQVISACAESSRTTHAAVSAVDACRYYGGLIFGALNGASKEELLAPAYTPVPGYWEQHLLSPEIASIAAGSFRHKQPPEIRGSGYVAHSLEAALWAFYHSLSFRHGCLLAVNLGDDTDTTGAIYGQLAGAFYAVEGIPPQWRGRLAHRAMIETFARQLYSLSLRI